VSRWQGSHKLIAVVGLTLLAAGVAFRASAHNVEDVMLSYVIIVLSIVAVVYFAKSAIEHGRAVKQRHHQRRDILESLMHELTEIRSYAEHFAGTTDVSGKSEVHLPTSVIEFVLKSDAPDNNAEEREVTGCATKLLPVVSDVNWRIHAIIADRHLATSESGSADESWGAISETCNDVLLPLVNELAGKVNRALAALTGEAKAKAGPQDQE
jgi:hypothetical protein